MVDVLRVVSSLEPGQWVEFPLFEFDSLPGWDFLSRSIESKCDRILENVVGSGYGWWYEMSPINQDRVTFKRRKTPLREGERTYVSPDRRDHYEMIREGLWRLHSQSDAAGEPKKPLASSLPSDVQLKP